MKFLEILKKLVKTKKVLAWGIASLVLVAFIVTANILATDTFVDLINGVLGGEKAIVDKNVQYRLFTQTSKAKKKLLKMVMPSLKKFVKKAWFF